MDYVKKIYAIAYPFIHCLNNSWLTGLAYFSDVLFY